MRRLFLVFLLLATIAQARAQALDTPLKTESGCSYFTTAEHVALRRNSNLQFQSAWDGRCVDGLTEGLGTMTSSHQNSDGKRVVDSRLTQRHHQGLGFGYAKNESIFELYTFVNYYFSEGPRSVGFGLGFSGAEEAVMDERAPPPSPDPSKIAAGQSATDGTTLVMFNKEPCAIHKDLPQFSGCGFSAEQQKYDIYVVTRYLRDAPDKPMAKMTVTPCPDPRTPAACTDTVMAAVQPLVAAISAFLDTNRPAYERRLAAMHATLAPLEQAEHAREQQAAADKASAERAFNDTLAKGGPGELFALADERKSNNDPGGARSALRALVKRFPDHALAKVAAAELLNK